MPQNIHGLFCTVDVANYRRALDVSLLQFQQFLNIYRRVSQISHRFEMSSHFNVFFFLQVQDLCWRVCMVCEFEIYTLMWICCTNHITPVWRFFHSWPHSKAKLLAYWSFRSMSIYKACCRLGKWTPGWGIYFFTHSIFLSFSFDPWGQI